MPQIERWRDKPRVASSYDPTFSNTNILA